MQHEGRDSPTRKHPLYNTDMKTTAPTINTEEDLYEIPAYCSASVRKAVARVLRYWKEYGISKAEEGVTTLQVKYRATTYGALWLYTETVRNDCDKYSQRAMWCKDGAHYCISKRGKVTVHNTLKLCSSTTRAVEHKKHLAHMVDGHVDLSKWEQEQIQEEKKAA